MTSSSERRPLNGSFTLYGTMKTDSVSDGRSGHADTEELPVGALPSPPVDNARKNGLHRGLSARQVQMIAIGGTIGTGLFLGTGRSLAQGGPASMLICYAIIGFIVYITLLLLGEMATQYPVAGELYSCTFTWRVYASLLRVSISMIHPIGTLYPYADSFHEY